MTWLWLLAPILLLATAAALWRLAVGLDRHRAELDDRRRALRPDGPDPAHR